MDISEALVAKTQGIDNSNEAVIGRAIDLIKRNVSIKTIVDGKNILIQNLFTAGIEIADPTGTKKNKSYCITTGFLAYNRPNEAS